jgi:hypothetical protein
VLGSLRTGGAKNSRAGGIAPAPVEDYTGRAVGPARNRCRMEAGRYIPKLGKADHSLKITVAPAKGRALVMAAPTFTRICPRPSPQGLTRDKSHCPSRACRNKKGQARKSARLLGPHGKLGLKDWKVRSSQPSYSKSQELLPAAPSFHL